MSWMTLLGIAGVVVLVVWLVGMVVYRKIISWSIQRRVSREISESAIGKIVERFTKFVASKKESGNELTERFCRGQRLRFHSENDGAGPLIYGTVIKPKFRGLRALLRGDDGREYRRKYSILERINFPIAVDHEAADLMARLERAAGFGAVNPPDTRVLTAN